MPLPGIETFTSNGSPVVADLYGGQHNRYDHQQHQPASGYGQNQAFPIQLEGLQPVRTEEIVRLRNDGGGIAIVETNVHFRGEIKGAITLSGRTLAPFQSIPQ